MDNIGLIQQAQAGDRCAFNTLIRTYQSLVYTVAYRLLGDPEAAADATQEAFIHAYQALTSYQSNSFRAWLLRITANICYDQMRYRRRRPALSFQAIAPDEAMDESELSVLQTCETPEEYVLRQDFMRTIEAGLALLPEKQRLVVMLADIHGFTYDEIATALGDNLGTVKSRLSRGRAQLRDYLAAPLRELGWSATGHTAIPCGRH